ncbi:TrmH family RNA methyltransferase [Ectobacillus polymachus]|uniref:TrmH family RNA methyltransferase n=1 Tax=Ectobacillus polymachus TaxID=1508806 RepID=UPI003A8AEC31
MKKIDSQQNARVKQWKKLHTKKERDKTGLFIVEGFHLVEEALKSKGTVRELIIHEQVDVPSHWDISDMEVYIVSDSVIQTISETETPQGIVAICEKAEAAIRFEKGKYLLLDGIQDPGNLGTIIRTADAAGLDAIILGEGTVDVYNSKVLRSTQGSIFHLPIIKGQLEEIILDMQKNHIPVYGTALHNAVPYTQVSQSINFALLLGNEGNGVRQELLDRCDNNLYIPIIGQAESLNVAVAAGILTYYLQSQVANS